MNTKYLHFVTKDWFRRGKKKEKKKEERKKRKERNEETELQR